MKGSITAVQASGVLETLLRQNAELSPKKSAIETPTQEITYSEWINSIEEHKSFLLAQEDFKNQKVALQLKPTLPSLTTLIALESLGSEILLLNPKATPLETQSILNQFRARLLLETESAFPKITHLEHNQTGSSHLFAVVTSGTTGAPRIIHRSWKELEKNAQAFARAAHYSAEDRVLCTTPLHHSYALSTAFMASMVSQATLLLTAENARPTYAVATARERLATVVQSIPFVYQNMIRSLSSLPQLREIRLFLSAGESLNQNLISQWHQHTGRGITNHYGTTELGMITLCQEHDFESVGFPLPEVEIRIKKESELEQSIQQKEWGEIQVKSNQEWKGTGDLGCLSTDGRIFLKGRLIPLLNLAGNKIDPLEIENILLEIPCIRECIVLGRSSPHGPDVHIHTEWIEAIVSLKTPWNEEEVRRHLASRLSPHKIPKVFTVVESLPRTDSGKIRRG